MPFKKGNPIGASSRFEKGNKMRPANTRGVPPEISMIKSLSRDELKKRARVFFDMPREKLAEVGKDPNSPAFEVAIASILANAISTGDSTRISWLMDMCFGKEREVVESHIFNHDDLLDTIPTEELLKLAKG